jgi:hypothetical protein
MTMNATAIKTYCLKRGIGAYDGGSRITFTVREGEDRAVMIKHHHDPTEPAKYSPSFHINVEGVEKIIYCNIWNHPEFAAKVWKSFTTPIPPSENSVGHPPWVMAEMA